MLDVLLPQRCLVCDDGGRQLCSPCREALPVIRAPVCDRCGAPTSWPVARCRECSGRRLAFAWARAGVAYDEPVRRLVEGWKERGLRRLADDLATVLLAQLPPTDAGLVTFVPADRQRLAERGHHPAERLARALAEQLRLPCEPALERLGRSRRQRGLPLAQRLRNVAGAFGATAPVSDTVLLIDDVYTSGSTVSAAAEALRAAGADRVDVATFARTIKLNRAT